MYENFLAQRLSDLRRKKGSSARDMSLSIGQNPNYINHVETGKINPSMQAFFYICEYLNVSPKEFFDDSVELPTLLNELTKELKTLDETALTHLLGLAKELNGK